MAELEAPQEIEPLAPGLPTLRTGFYLVEGAPDRRLKRYLIEDEDYG